MSVAYLPRSAATKLTIAKGKKLRDLLSENGLDGKLDLVAQYNWGTKSPVEINRALIELVGCESFAVDPLDSVLDPGRGTGGAIYKPQPWTAELPTAKTYKAKVKQRLPATTAAITDLPFLFNPATDTCTVRYTLAGDASRGDKKDFEIHATGYFNRTLDREGGGSVVVDKPSGTVSTSDLKDTHIVRKSEAAAPGDADYPWKGDSEATVGVLKTPAKITSVCAPYFVSVRYYKDSTDQTAFIAMEPFYPRWKLTGKAKWEVDEKSLVVKWKLQGGDSSKAKLKHGQIRVYDQDGLAFFAPLTQDQIKGGSYDLLQAAIHWDKTKVDQQKLPYRIQIQAHSDDEEDNGLALAVMPTQVPGYNYKQVQFIGFNIRNDTTPTGKDYLGHSNPDTDINLRCKAMIQAIQLAAPQTEQDRKVLKVFMAPEFYFRGSAGAYPIEKISTIVPKLREETDKYAYLDWLFVFGTALAYQKHETKPAVPARHGTAEHRLKIVKIETATEITAKVWSMPQKGWKFETQTQQKVIAASPGAMGPKDPLDGGSPLRITLNNTSGLIPGELAYTLEPVMTILETVPPSAPTTDKIKVASGLCSRIPVDPATNGVVTIGGSFWAAASEGKAGWITNVEYVPVDDNFILTLSAPDAYEAGKPLELVEPVSSELFNIALMQKGWHAPHLGDGLRQVVTYKEDLSHIDFIRDKSLEFYDPWGRGRKIRLNSTDDVLLLPTEGGKDIGGASPNVQRQVDSVIGSEINENGLGGGCVVMVDRITFGMEVCRDHCVHRLFNYYTGSNVRALDPLVQVQLIPSWGMAIGMADPGKEISALPAGLVFNVDGSRMESVARVWDAKYSCDGHVTVAKTNAAKCAGDWTVLDAGTLYYVCDVCPPPTKYYTAACTSHPLKRCGKDLRKIGTALTPKSPIQVPLSNAPAYFKTKGNVRVFPAQSLPDPDVATTPPTLTDIVDGSAKPGFDVEITLKGTGLAEVRAVNVDGAGVTVTSFSVVSDAQVKAKLQVKSNAAVGNRNVTASTFSGPSNAMVFQVEVPPAPTLASVTPDEGEVAYLYDIVLKGTDLQPVYRILFSTAGVALTQVKAKVDGQIDLKIDVQDVAAPGPCTITVTSAGGSATIVFTVKARPLPTVTSVAPHDYLQGLNYSGIIVTGTNLWLTQTVTISGGDLVIGSSAVDNDAQITLRIAVNDTAPPGNRNLTVTTLSGDSAPYALTVEKPDPPDLDDIDPDSEAQGFKVTVHLTGTDLLTVRDVDVSGSGVTVVNVYNATDTEMDVDLDIDETAAPGDRDVTVTTLGGSDAITFEVEARPAPTLTLVTPDSANRGTTVQITVDGSDILHFERLEISGGGITVTIDDDEDDKVVATLNIAGSAAPGDRQLTVTSHGGKSAPLVFKVV